MPGWYRLYKSGAQKRKMKEEEQEKHENMTKTIRIGNFFAAMDKSSRNSPIDASFTSLSHELQTSTSS